MTKVVNPQNILYPWHQYATTTAKRNFRGHSVVVSNTSLRYVTLKTKGLR